MGNLLILAETDGTHILDGTLPVITFAQQFASLANHTYDLLIVGGPDIGTDVEKWRGYDACNVWIAALPELTHPTADRVATLCTQFVRQTGTSYIAGAASTFGRDILPRVAGLLDLPMLSDVLSIEQGDNGPVFKRPLYAGNIIATVQVSGEAAVFSIRGTVFPSPAVSGAMSEIVEFTVDPASLPRGTQWIGLDAPEQKRPELTTARVVVSGGRPLRDAETFERLLGGLADKLGGAVGATRAAVDSGIAPNELQIGQTGKVVAPELYIAAGVSGSVQHLAGMKESKVIVAVNSDADAPIFEVADYGLVADLHQAIPELIEKL